MKADLTRNSFDPQKHYSRVILQQGRVQLDADWNEQVASLIEATRQVARDLSIAMAAPAPFSPVSIGDGSDFEISAGRLYVDGIAIQTATPVPVRRAPSSSDLIVARWTVDAREYAVGQALRLSAENVTVPSDPFTISAVDFATQRLTCAPDPNLPDQETPATPVGAVAAATRVVTYLDQPNLPHAPELPAKGYFYIDVWERHMTALEDDTLVEVALGGPTTADRARVVWQVKWCAIPPGAVLDPDGHVHFTPGEIARIVRGGDSGALRARVRPEPTSTDPCTAAPGAPYRGAENQLYRVEVNTGSIDAQGDPQTPTFKWSRDNGAVVFRITGLVPGTDTTTVMLDTLGPDDRFGLQPGQRVEVCDDESALWQRPGQLLAVQSIDRTQRTVVLAGALAADMNGRIVGRDPSMHPMVRRWDHGSPDDASSSSLAEDGCVAVVPASIVDGDGAWQALEDGVEVLFENFDPNAAYLPGDYWLIPARVATADLVWPKETGVNPAGDDVTWPAARRPDGIDHHYASLGDFATSARAAAGPAADASPAHPRRHAAAGKSKSAKS